MKRASTVAECSTASPGALPLAIRQATAVGVSAEGVLVEMAGRSRLAAIAVPFLNIVVGDTVLVVQNESGDLLAIGLGARSAAPRSGLEVTPNGDVVLRSEGGRVLVEAGTNVEIRATKSLDLTAAELEVTADIGSLHVREASVIADTIRTTADEIATTVGRWELRARRIVERATDAVRSYQGLLHIGAGRARTVVRENFAIAAKRTSITSQEDTVVDGKRVLLG